MSLLLLANLVAPILLIATPQAEAQGPGDYVFHTYEDLYRDMQDLADQYPELMELDTIGEAIDQGQWKPDHPYNKRQLWNAHLTDLTNETGIDERPAIYIDGDHHGNEQAGVETAFLLVKYLVERYGTDERITSLLQTSHIYITPMINPDGNARDTRYNTRGVDLNRNYPFHWTPDIDHGSGPASEPEIAANVDFMRSIEPEIYLTQHTGIVLLIYAWSYTFDLPPDWPMYQMAGDAAAQEFGIPNNQASSGLYTAMGTSKDFGYGDRLAPSWTFEVDEEQFNPVSDEPVEERLADMIEVNLRLMEYAATGQLRPHPELAWASVPRTIEPDEHFSIIFNVTNSGFGYIENGTARLVPGNGLDVDPLEQNFTLFPYNSTEIVFNMTADEAGTFDYELELEYRSFMIRNNSHQSVMFAGEFEVEEDSRLLKVLTSPYGIFGLILLLVIIGIVIFKASKE